MVAQTHGIEILGPVGVAARTAANVADALKILERFLTAFSPGLGVRLQPTEVKDLVFFDGIRRERADNLLRHTNVPLTQLARDLGYASTAF